MTSNNGEQLKKTGVNLVVVAHPDDEVLGFGATGAKLVDLGEEVQPVLLCGDVNARTKRPTSSELHTDILHANSLLGFREPVLGDYPNIRMNAVDHIEIVQFIEKQIEKFNPSRIFTHYPFDLNNDHVVVSRACMAASRLFQRKAEVTPLRSLGFMEIQSSTDWGFSLSGETFNPNLYIEIESYIDKKLDALKCYRRVMREYPHPRSVEAIKGLAAYRGGQSGFRYAEAFKTIFQRELV